VRVQRFDLVGCPRMTDGTPADGVSKASRSRKKVASSDAGLRPAACLRGAK
jgi:hypothetical protein